MPMSKEKRREYDRSRRKGGERERANPNAARTAKREAHAINFVGVDGEGVDRPNGAHDYNILSVGDRSFNYPDGRRLTTNDVFHFLWDQHDPQSVYVGYFLGYDIAQWLRDLPEERAKMLLTTEGQNARRRTDSHGNTVPFPVQWGRWEFDLLPNMKRFKLRPAGSRVPWFYVCDAGPLYQCSFLKAIDPAEWEGALPVCTPEEFAVIQAGKAARSDNLRPLGTPVDPEVIEYNRLENGLLARLMERTNEGLVAMGLKLTKTQWHGPGQAAQAWLKATAPDHTGDECRAAVDVPRGTSGPSATEEALDFGPHDAAQASYFGGWFEITAHGIVPGITHEYDINSAYPTIIANLPCLLHGTWTHGTGRPPRRKAAYRLLRADVYGSDPFIGPMPHRDFDGAVFRPSATSGWMWHHELEASRRAGLVDRCKYHEWWEYQPCNCAPPFRAIAQLYEHRLTAGKKTPQGKGMKLVYNSAYGKMAQSVGHPLYGNAVYASLITAGCRSMILDAIATHPGGTEAVLMVATDGVYFTDPHPGLDIDPARLGAWDAGTKENLSLLKPGVYWDDKARRALRTGGRLDIKSRGINVVELGKVIDDIDRQWSRFTVERMTDPTAWPTFTLAVPFSIIGPKQALNRRKWDLCGHIVHDAEAVQSAAPHRKRLPQPNEAAHDGLLRTRPHENPRCHPSKPYEKTFGLAMEERTEELPMIDDDDLSNLLAEYLGHHDG